MSDMFWLFLLLTPPVFIGVILASYVYLEYRRDRIPIILYHRLISKADAAKGLVPDTEMVYVCYDTCFAEQMRYLHENAYTTLNLDDYLAIRRGAMPLPSRPVVITFDDGYESNYRFAFPVLRNYGMKATIFVAPEPDEHTRNLVVGVDGFLKPDQMREMVSNGISIESHTVTHCILTALDDRTVNYELDESRRILGEITGKPVEHIAIPRAGYSRHIRRMVIAAGYKTACCNNKGSSNGWSDPLALPRIVVERDTTLSDFARLLKPPYAIVLRVVGNIKRIPERVGGARFARRVRTILYTSPLKPLFKTHNLKRVIFLAGLAYVLCVGFIVSRLVSG